MKNIKEKVLKAVKKEYDWWEMREPEELLFNETLNLTLAEVGKAINDWKFELVGMLNMKAFHNKEIEVPLDIEDIEELKQKLGIK